MYLKLTVWPLTSLSSSFMIALAASLSVEYSTYAIPLGLPLLKKVWRYFIRFAYQDLWVLVLILVVEECKIQGLDQHKVVEVWLGILKCSTIFVRETIFNESSSSSKKLCRIQLCNQIMHKHTLVRFRD